MSFVASDYYLLPISSLSLSLLRLCLNGVCVISNACEKSLCDYAKFLGFSPNGEKSNYDYFTEE